MDSSDCECPSDDGQYRDIINAYLGYLAKQRNYSAHTVRAYGADMRSYVSYAIRQGFDVLAPSVREVRGYLSDQMRARYARRTINRRLSSLRTFFRWLNEVHISDSNAVCAVQGPKIPKHLPRVLSPAEIDELFSFLENDLALQGESSKEHSRPAQCAPSQPSLNIGEALSLRDAALFEVLYATGARVSEIADLTLGQVDCEAGRMKLTGKGSKERYVLLHDQGVSMLRRYLDLARPVLLEHAVDGAARSSEGVFLSKLGKALSADALRKIFKKKALQAGLDASTSPHALRHTFATDLLNGGADLRSVQELLGHASLSTTQVYTHLTADRLMKVHSKAHPRG